MAITLTIKSIVSNGSNIVISAVRSDNANLEEISIDLNYSLDMIKTAIKNKVGQLNQHETLVTDLQSLKGQIF